MAAPTSSLTVRPRIEDALSYLPASSITSYRKREMIYGPETGLGSIYLVVTGKVAISRINGSGREVLLDIMQPEDIFGEIAFLYVAGCSERATALEATSLMSWSISDIEALAASRPRLALALIQNLARRSAVFATRVESLALEAVEQRLGRALVRFSARLGTVQEDGTTRLMPLTHEMLSNYVGTSREVVTQCMSRFRKRGYLRYSRSGIYLFGDALELSLAAREVPVPVVAG